jgi:hypothetical protein
MRRRLFPLHDERHRELAHVLHLRDPLSLEAVLLVEQLLGHGPARAVDERVDRLACGRDVAVPERGKPPGKCRRIPRELLGGAETRAARGGAARQRSVGRV